MDNQTPSPRRLHPLVATAAGGIIVASLVATAAVTGLFPKASSTGAQNDQTQAAQVASQAVVDSAAPSVATANQQYAQRQPAQEQNAQPQPGQDQYAQQQQQYAQQQQPRQQYAQQQYAQQQPAEQQYAQQQPAEQPYAPQQPAQQQYAPQQQPAAAACQSCGTVEGISAVRHEGHGTGIGAVGGAVAGGLIGNQFGAGNGRTAMTVLGAVGGGFGGNAVEKHLRSTTVYQVRVRMDNGHTRYFTYHDAPPFQQGERVRVEHGTLAAG